MTSSVKDQNYFPFNNYQRINKIGSKNSSKYNTVVKTEHKNKYTILKQVQCNIGIPKQRFVYKITK